MNVNGHVRRNEYAAVWSGCYGFDGVLDLASIANWENKVLNGECR